MVLALSFTRAMVGDRSSAHYIRRQRCLVAAGGASPMPAELINFWLSLGLPMVEGYGPTVVCPDVKPLPSESARARSALTG